MLCCVLCVLWVCVLCVCMVCLCVSMALWVEVLVVKSKDLSWDPQDAHNGINSPKVL